MIFAALFIGVALWLLLWITFQLGKVKGREESLPRIARVAEDAFSVGYLSAERAREAVEGVGDHRRAQWEKARNREQ